METENSFVVVCTDRELLYLAIESMLEGVFRCERVPLETLGILFQRFDAVAPDTVILDSETGVPQLIRRVRKGLPAVPVVVWQRDNAAEASLHALELGAAGVLHDNSTVTDIRACLNTVQEGHIWVPKSVSQASLDFRRYRLSPREWQVMHLITQGLCNKEIAYSLGITEGTTKVYLSRMFDKLEVTDRYELALLGLRHFALSRKASATQGRNVRNDEDGALEHPQSVFVYRPSPRSGALMERA